MKPKIQKTGAELIAEERQRQMSVEGWTEKHDDEHKIGQLATAGVCYAKLASTQLLHDLPEYTIQRKPALWPWEDGWWKPSKDIKRNLVKAGALLAAEIDRLNRLEPAPQLVENFVLAADPAWEKREDELGNDVWRANSPYHNDGDPMVYELSQKFVKNKVKWYFTGGGDLAAVWGNTEPLEWDSLEQAKAACAEDYQSILEVERIKAKPVKKKVGKLKLDGKTRTQKI